MLLELNDNDPGCVCIFIRFQIKLQTKTHDRDNLTTQIDHTLEVALCLWYSCDSLVADDIIHILYVNAILL